MEVEHEAESVFRRKEMLSSWVHPELKFLSHQRLPMLFFHLEGRGGTEITLGFFFSATLVNFAFLKRYTNMYIYF